MAEFESDLGKIKRNNFNLREFVVDDTSQEQSFDNFQERISEANLQDELKAVRKKKEEEKSKLSDQAKKRIEALLGMFKSKKEFEVNGVVFVLKTLKSNEIRDITNLCLNSDGNAEFSFEWRRHTIANSLISVGGVDIDLILGTKDYEAKLEFVDNLDNALLGKIYDEYTVLLNEQKKRLGIVSEEDAKKVVEDVKK